MARLPFLLSISPIRLFRFSISNEWDIFDWVNYKTVHGEIYLGKSKDKTKYVFTKNGWNDSPEVMTLEEVKDEYDAWLQEGNSTYNYIGD